MTTTKRTLDEMNRLRNENTQLRSALANARASLTAFGGDSSSVAAKDVDRLCVDKIQWTLLRQIDRALKLEN